MPDEPAETRQRPEEGSLTYLRGNDGQYGARRLPEAQLKPVEIAEDGKTRSPLGNRAVCPTVIGHLD